MDAYLQYVYPEVADGGWAQTDWPSSMMYEGEGFVRLIGRAQALRRTRLGRIGIRGRKPRHRLSRLQGTTFGWTVWPLVIARYGPVRDGRTRRVSVARRVTVPSRRTAWPPCKSAALREAGGLGRVVCVA